jgi:hypothetical protein
MRLASNSRYPVHTTTLPTLSRRLSAVAPLPVVTVAE